MRILIRTSKWSIWARRLGSVAGPLVIISVALHRFRLITSDLFLVAAAAACIVALAALLVSLIALARLWQTGDQGWSRALTGLVFGLLCLAPFAWYGNLAMRYPAVTDIATIDRGLMPLVFEPGTAAMPPPKLLTTAEMAAVFPNVETRTYPLGQTQTFALVQALVADNGWDIRLLREPTDTFGPAQINAQIMTIPGWREEAVVRVTGTATTSTVDMRSASLNAIHDFGANGLRIEDFLSALDDAVTTLLRDNPNANQPVEVEPEDEAGEDETAADGEAEAT
ncbi:DUF1499 domain-containing protein [Devosia sp. SL43]|uniref:DUF1499 domain-containing protein n=1 Tax=Devosia sp. SL43 TaxID=2806348 RepID=UPI001F3CBBA7|nr:DUF1499 domain-containing protein [Devosia sp. SL43]UJW85333.1 DUF1499 domain-containing protein [Devosia sp. SL43]